VKLANNTRYGLAASVWSENVNLALDMAPQLKCGVVWINATNLFDAACGFGGYRESGFGREGGREGLYEYARPVWEARLPLYPATKTAKGSLQAAPSASGGIDRTAKMYVGGKQARPDSGYSRPVFDAKGRLLAEVGDGNRKDIRNAVEAAAKAEGWSRAAGHLRAQILYYVAENLDARGEEFAKRLQAMTGATKRQAEREVEASVRRLFTYAAWADKYDGQIHVPPMRDVTLAMNEPLGVIGIACPNEAPLLGLISLVAPAVAMGNRVVVIPSEPHPLSATDFYQVLDTSDVPGGVVNIVTGARSELSQSLASHDDVDAMWYVAGDAAGSAVVEKESVGNLKQTWVNFGRRRDWYDPQQGEGQEYLRHATQVKNVWVPYGE
jgi:aldehyde dehydrogenase (NAD+)